MKSLLAILLLGSAGTVAADESRPQTSKEVLLNAAESRLRAIYDRDEFRARRFQANWLPDSSGYTVLEPAADGKERERVRYDAASGNRTVLGSPANENPGGSGDVSPDGKSVRRMRPGLQPAMCPHPSQ